MKKHSLTYKLTIWYTAFMVVIFLILAAIITFIWNLHIIDQIEAELLDEVTDADEHVITRNGEILVTRGIDLYDDNVYISIFDENLKLIKGKNPASIEEYPDFTDEGFERIKDKNENEWYVYIRQYFVDDRYVWIRGVIESPAAISSNTKVIPVILILIPILIMLGIAGGYLMTKRALAPVREIVQTANEIGASEDLSRRLTVSGTSDEIDSIAEAYNGMFERLERIFISEKQFTADVSHELRTPIAVILSQSEYALEEPEYTGKALKTISREAGKMKDLISRLLMISRSDSGRLNLEKEEMSFSEICRDIAEQERELAEKCDISLTEDIDDDIFIYGDYLMIARVVINLVDNAIKYGKNPGGIIDISLKKDNDYAVLTVSDDGDGIEEDKLERIWDRFYKISSREDSTGLGLAMVKSLVGAHGGTVTAESTVGEGSSFIIKIPVKN